MILTLAMSMIAAPTAAERQLFEPYRQCVLTAARYSGPRDSIESVRVSAETMCGGQVPIAFMSKAGFEMRHTLDREQLAPDVQATLVAALRNELGRQHARRRHERSNAQD